MRQRTRLLTCNGNDKGSLEKYNTLREIPDTYFAAYLKNLFASIFVDDTHIDISKPLGILEKGTNINLWAPLQYEDIDKIQSIRGVEYFVNNPFMKTSLFLLVMEKQTLMLKA